MAQELTAAQNKIVSRKVSLSLSIAKRLAPKLIAAYPSCTFKCLCANNGGVTSDYQVTGPAAWVNKIARKWSY